MDKLVITGNCKLNGEVEIHGAKNAALPILVATILTDEDILLQNIPDLRDITTMIKVLEHLGKTIQRNGREILIKQTTAIKTEAPYDLVKQMRASALVMGPLLTRYFHVKVSLPGGCAIGARPINIHLDGFKHFGAAISLDKGYVRLKCAKLFGTKIVLDFPSVGATENLVMAATLAEGLTVLENVAKEPEIIDLCEFLNKMGAKIIGYGSDKIQIEGVRKLSGVEHKVISDRIEAGTFMIAAALCAEEVLIKNIELKYLDFLTTKMQDSGVKIIEENGCLRVFGTSRIQPINIETLPYPGFPTDMQAQWVLYMTQADGASLVTETVFENRFMHIPELERMGANLTINGHTVFVGGNSSLKGAPVMATDLRASAALVLAALIAEGETEIHRVYHLDRGYENIEKKLQKLGACIERLET
ncbi:MAG: UDP-N-acetylglucosamine 1-carboxyvinyltransferase [bacterium]|nr:UDP-N-acetylglucosamine 1-carboxyvinyltransferase [bacterium]